MFQKSTEMTKTILLLSNFLFLILYICIFIIVFKGEFQLCKKSRNAKKEPKQEVWLIPV